MMKGKHFALIIFLLGICIKLQAQDSLSTTEGFGREVFRSFQTNSYELFSSLLINEVKYESILEKSTLSDQEKKASREMGLGAVKHIQSQARSNFDEVMKTARQHRIDWKFASVVKVEFVARENDQLAGVERGDFLIHAEYGNTNFVIVVTNCFKGEVWSIMSPVKLIVQE